MQQEHDEQIQQPGDDKNIHVETNPEWGDQLFMKLKSNQFKGFGKWVGIAAWSWLQDERKVGKGWEGRAYELWSVGPMIGRVAHSGHTWHVGELIVEKAANSLSSWQVRAPGPTRVYRKWGF